MSLSSVKRWRSFEIGRTHGGPNHPAGRSQSVAVPEKKYTR